MRDWAPRVHDKARDSAQLCMRRCVAVHATVHCVVHCLGNYSWAVSRTLFMGTVKKKKNPRKLGRLSVFSKNREIYSGTTST